MASITFKGTSISTVGDLPAVGTAAPAFTLVGGDLSDVSLGDYAGKRVILNIVPSLDTGICQASARRFNEAAGQLENTVIINASLDLPFAQGRFCESEGLSALVNASAFRSPEFGIAYGATMSDGPLAGLLSRAIVIIDESGQVIYTEQVPEIVQEPDYESALKALA